MSTPSLLDQATEAIKAGDTLQARNLLTQLLKTEPQAAQAWLLLSACWVEPEKKRYCLEKAASLQPDDPQILQALSDLAAQSGEAAASAPAAGAARAAPGRAGSGSACRHPSRGNPAGRNTAGWRSTRRAAPHGTKTEIQTPASPAQEKVQLPGADRDADPAGYFGAGSHRHPAGRAPADRSRPIFVRAARTPLHPSNCRPKCPHLQCPPPGRRPARPSRRRRASSPAPRLSGPAPPCR